MRYKFFYLFLAVVLIALSLTIIVKNSRQKETSLESSPLAQGLFFDGEHYRGSQSAPVVVVEYGEVECPYCKDFHYSMKKILDEYGDRVTWVYRHFPLASHPKSTPEAIALECASELGGEEVFWEYLDVLFKTTPSNNKMDLSLLSPLAVNIGAPQAEFEECLGSERHQERVQNDRNSGVLWGATKVPHIIIITTKNGKEFPVSGGASYQFTKNLIDIALAQE